MTKRFKILFSVFVIAAVVAFLNTSTAAPPRWVISNTTVNGQPTSYTITNGGLVSFAIYDHFSMYYNVVDPDHQPTTINYIESPSTGFTPPPPWGIGPLCQMCYAPALPLTCPCFQTNRIEVRPEVPFTGTLILKATDTDGEWSLLVLYFDYALPVDFSSFTANVNRNNVTLKWTTTNENNNSFFAIERKDARGGTWSTVGTVNGSGTTTLPVNYTFVDKKLAVGSYDYRLKQVDVNGNYKYYELPNTVTILASEVFELSQNYPNPFNPTTVIGYQLPFDGNVTLNVYDNTGRLVTAIANGFQPAGYYEVTFNGSNLSSGIYYYRLEVNSNGRTFEKVMKMSLVK